MTDGWIKIHRQFLDHWLCTEYRPLTRREAWENIILWANYKESECLIKGQMIKCERGQLLYSLETYAQKFNWSVGQVRQFLKLLENDKMIKLEGLKYTTRLTICNYDKWQDEQQTDNKLTTDSQQTDNRLATTREERKEGKEKKERKEKIYSEQAHSLYSDLVILFDEKLRPETEAKKNKWLDVCEKLLKSNTPDHIKQVVKRARMDDFWGKNFLSLMKLEQSNKDGVKYFTVFEQRFNFAEPQRKFVM